MRYRRVAVVTLVTAMAFVGVPNAAHAAPLNQVIPDAALRRCITDKIGIGADSEPTAEQLASIVELSCLNKGIKDLTGVVSLPSLTKLFLNNNQISDLKPLSGATKIFSLGLGNNQIDDITPLRSLKKLRSVALENNRLSDISVLGSLPEWVGSKTGTRHGQKAVGSPAQAGTATAQPTVTGYSGNKVTPEPPDGLKVVGGLVTYPSEGEYTWRFRDESDLSFNGTITVTVSAASSTTIPDDGLRACINSRLGITDPATHPTKEQLAGLKGHLNCTKKGITSLSGVQFLTGITGLRLSNNEISDPGPIAPLKQLTLLDLTMNNVTSLAPLGHMPELKTLNISQSSATADKRKLSSLAGVERFPALTALTVNQQALDSLAPLAGNKSLKNLTATNNELTDVSPLASASGLTNVVVDSNKIADLSSLKDRKFTKISVKEQTLTAPKVVAKQSVPAPSVVNLDGAKLLANPPAGIARDGDNVTYPSEGNFTWTFSNAKSPFPETFSGTIAQEVSPAPPPVVDVTIKDANLRACFNKALGQESAAPITKEQLAGLAKVSCINSGITDLAGAELLTGATEIQLATNQITDLTPLAQLTNLKVLGIPGNKVTDLTPIGKLASLTKLNASYNPITSIKPLAGLSALEELTVTQKSKDGYPGLTSLDGIESLTTLTRFVANNSQITDLGPVAGLTNLKALYVNFNKVESIQPLANLTNLERLGLDHNEISDISPLAKLTKLTTLSLAENHVFDLSPLKSHTKWGYGEPRVARQQVDAPKLPAQLAVNPPTVIGLDGQPVTLTPPDGINLVDGKVTYPAAGSYVWTWNSNGFSGKVTQDVTAPTPAAANIPDARLRECIAKAAGLPEGSAPTKPQVAAITALQCTGQPITDLTGVELLTGATSLDLSNTGLSDVAKLASLTQLTTLKLDGNAIRDLGALQPLTATLSARDQRLRLPDVKGGEPVAVPQVMDKAGSAVSASAPTGHQPVDGKVTFTTKGDYAWPFTAMNGVFTGEFAQRVTQNAPKDPSLFAFTDADVMACVTAGKVFVIVDPVTVNPMGGCASKFSTGVEALISAGFTIEGDAFITEINGYRVDGKWWAYYHRHRKQERDAGELWGDWEFSQQLASVYKPKPGSVEGWVLTPTDASQPRVTPRWAPTPTPTPTPTPAPTPTPTPDPTSTPSSTVSSTQKPSAGPTSAPSSTATPTSGVSPTPSLKPSPTSVPTPSTGSTPTASPSKPKSGSKPSVLPRTGR